MIYIYIYIYIYILLLEVYNIIYYIIRSYNVCSFIIIIANVNALKYSVIMDCRIKFVNIRLL